MKKNIGLVVGLLLVLAGWSGVFAATPPQPTYGTATVDGGYNEWNLAEDGFAEMHRGANPKKDVLSRLYLRYGCSTHTLYALVLVEPGHTIDVDAGQPGEEHYVKINGVKIVSDVDGPPDGIPPDLQWIGLVENTALGWEASAPLTPGAYTDFNVHTQVDDGQTSAVEGRAIELVVECPTNDITLSSFTARSPGGTAEGLGFGPEVLWGGGLAGGLALVALYCLSRVRKHSEV